MTQGLPDRLRKAFAFLFPDGHYADYRPDVVDFFSALSTYVDIGEGLAGTGLQGARDLYEQLQFAIGHLLVEKTREVDGHLEAGHRYLDEMVKSGNIIITSNWDCVIERYAQLKHVPLRHLAPSVARWHNGPLKSRGPRPAGMVSAGDGGERPRRH